MSTTLFNRGIPTEPDVITLSSRFGVPSENAPISYDDVAAVLGVPVGSSRFRTVTTAWRKQLRATHGIIMSARNGEFAVRTPSSRVMLGKSKTKSGVRCFSDALDVIVNTDRARLSERECADSDKVQRIASIARSAAMAEARKRPTPALRPVGSGS